MPTNPQEGNTVQLSPVWVLIAALLIILMGMVGGMVSQRLAGPSNNVPLVKDLKPLVTNVQQLTVSSSSLYATAVQNAQRSIVLLAIDSPAGKKIIGTGLVITNDGLVVASPQSGGATSAIDSDGHTSPLDSVGPDALYGLHYYRLQNGIFSPPAITDTDSPAGSLLLAAGRSAQSNLPLAKQFPLEQYIAAADAPAGITLLAKGAALTDSDSLTGAPLLTEEGKVAGLLLGANEGLALPSSALRRSIDRVTNQKRESDPFSTLGISVAYKYANTPDQFGSFGVFVQTVKPASIAAAAGLKAGDRITQVEDTALARDTNMGDVFAQPLPLHLTAMRDSQTLNLTLTAATPSP
jgi:S1-C subfamily serine protease